MDPNRPTSFPPSWLASLRARLTEIAARRVPEDAVEDLVQDAMQVVLEKGPEAASRDGAPTPPLAWCFLVLRNVIGNWYQKRRDHAEVDDLPLADGRPDPLAALATEERARTVRGAVEELRRTNADCARWLWSMAEGEKPAALAERAGVEAGAFYRRVYRCRKKLEAILRAKGVTP